MALANYTDLINAINGSGSWLHRNDLAAIAPDWVAMCEVTMNNGDLETMNIDGLRTGSQETAWTSASSVPAITVAGSQTVTLPADFLQMRTLYMIFGGVRVELSSFPALPMSASSKANVVAVPTRYYTQGNTLYFDTIVDRAYQLVGDYYAKIGPLTAATPTNWLMTAAPYTYLFGSIVHGALWLGPQFNAAPWIAGFKTAMSAVQRGDIKKRFSNNLMRSEVAQLQNSQFNILTGT